MAYIKQIYTAFMRVSGLKLWSLGDWNIVLFCFGVAPLSKIAQLQSPRAHSFNQSLSWPYIFVYYCFRIKIICLLFHERVFIPTDACSSFNSTSDQSNSLLLC